MKKTQQKAFKSLLENAEIEPKNNKQKFYEWLIRMNNKFTGDSELMSKAYSRIIEY